MYFSMTCRSQLPAVSSENWRDETCYFVVGTISLTVLH